MPFNASHPYEPLDLQGFLKTVPDAILHHSQHPTPGAMNRFAIMGA